MKRQLFLIGCCVLVLMACSTRIQVKQKETFAPRNRPQTIFVVPFTTIMVPEEVRSGLFDRFVDQLIAAEHPVSLEYIILKQGIEAIDAGWLAKRDYVTGEIFAYVEDFGSTTVSIRAKSRIRFYQADVTEPTMQLDYPVEVFFEKDYLTLEAARQKLALKISDGMAQKLSRALDGDK